MGLRRVRDVTRDVEADGESRCEVGLLRDVKGVSRDVVNRFTGALEEARRQQGEADAAAPVLGVAWRDAEVELGYHLRVRAGGGAVECDRVELELARGQEAQEASRRSFEHFGNCHAGGVDRVRSPG